MSTISGTSSSVHTKNTVFEKPGKHVWRPSYNVEFTACTWLGKLIPRVCVILRCNLFFSQFRYR